LLTIVSVTLDVVLVVEDMVPAEKFGTTGTA